MTAASGIRSRPVYPGLWPDPAARRHVLAATAAGAAAVRRVVGELPAGADVHVVWAADGPVPDLPTGSARAFPTEADALAALDRLLAECPMGTRVYVAGPDPFVGAAVRVAAGHDVHPADVRTECGEPGVRRVYCVHCKAVSTAAARVWPCAGCGRHLYVRDHYSRRLAAYMGVMADAEVPGELPPAEGLA